MEDYTIRTAEINRDIEYQEICFKNQLRGFLTLTGVKIVVNKFGNMVVNMPEQKMANGDMQYECSFEIGNNIDEYSI